MPSWFFDTGNPPFLRNEFPAPGASRVSTSVLISVDVLDAETFVDLSTLRVWVDGADAYNGSFVAPFNGPSSAITPTIVDGYDGYHIVVDKTVPYGNEEITVRVVADDYGGNTLDDSWTFSTGEITFLVEYMDTNIFNAEMTLTINSLDESPELCYNGDVATTSTWDSYMGWGAPLEAAGSVPDVTAGRNTPLLGTTDKSVLFNNGIYFWDSLGNVTGDMTSEDFVLSAMIKTPDYLTPGNIASKGNADGGWILRFTSFPQTAALTLYGTLGSTTIYTGELKPNTWYYISFYVDRGGNAYAFVDGKFSTVTEIIGLGSLTNSQRFAIGNSGGSFEVALVCLWNRTSWFTDANAGEIIATEGQRFREITKTHPVIAGTYTPELHTRASVAYLDKVESTGYRKYYRVGEDWFRTCRRYNGSGVATEDGLLVERRFYNQVVNPENFDAWTNIRMSVSPNATYAPDNMLTADRLRENSAYGIHFVQSDIAVDARDSEYYVASVFAKAVDRAWIRLEVLSSLNRIYRSCYFNVGSGVKGTAVNVKEAGIEDWKEGWYRCWFSWKAGPFEETIPWFPDKIRIYSATQDGVVLYTGTNMYTTDVAMAQVESDTCYPSNFTPENGISGVVKAVDNLSYFATDNIYDGYGVIEAYGMIPEHDLVAYDRTIMGISNGQDKFQRIQVYVDPVGDKGEAVVIDRIYPLVVPVAGTADIVDGYEHKLRFDYQDNNYAIFVDDVAGSTGTAETVPRAVDRITIGRSPGAPVTPDTSDSMLIRRVKIRR